MIESIFLCVVFTLFGLEVLARFGAWCFAQWRVWVELRESTVEDDVTASSSQ